MLIQGLGAAGWEWTVRAGSRTTATLEVTTDDGDQVSISLEASRLIEADRSDVAQTSLSVSVEGTVEKDELVDLKKLVLALAAATRDAGRGRAEHVARHAARAERLDSIESFRFAYARSSDLEFGTLNPAAPAAP
jgi:hypothetical protein